MEIADRAIFSGRRLAMPAVGNKVIRGLDEPLAGDSSWIIHWENVDESVF